MSYLLGITVGPVQTYIEESRKLGDLCNSSRIISDIMKEVHEHILNLIKTAELIYPNHKYVQDIDYSNYMIFEIEKSINLKSIESQIYERVYYNSEICNDKKIDFNYKNTIKESFHLFWAIEEIKDNKYGECYKNLTELMHNLKNTYEFEQVEQESQEKCLICGKRNVVNLSNFKKEKYKLKEEENLCEVCLFKRNYISSIRYNSVYEIAIINWKSIHEDELKKVTRDLAEIFKNYYKYYNKNEITHLIILLKKTKENLKKDFKENIKMYIDFSLNNIIQLLKDNKKKIVLKKLNNINEEFNNYASELTLDKLINKLSILEKELEDIYKKIQPPNYEYTFIQFDIDNLGCWMSGEYLKDKKNLKNHQKEISLVLCNFSQKLRESLKNKCEIIYSGGDDFLTILPSENIIEVIEIIDKEFKNEVELKLDKYMTYDRRITYSTSITIAQCKDPMSYSLAKTREELKNVKNRYKNESMEKNGVAINYIINNGKEITCYLQKEDLVNYFELIKGFKKVESKLSFSYINNFENEFKMFNFNNISFENAKKIFEIVDCEVKRLISRSKIKGCNEEKVNEYIKNLAKFIRYIFSKNNNELKSNHIVIDFRNVMNILRLYQKLCIDNLNRI
ncbi:hypothetical protein CF055_00750 [Clostridium botulinum]|uniref:Cas10/Cmr2 second palm domain-containing protein n=1 Tax=Clostridium botulinum TaxID=1491 RepID=UPI000C75888F|nr:type III-B CRISPR-associated protein Cas10/Cmr2 [Clostridium botulinum]AUM88166.1 hypothetical protein RSJ15_10845 [Clostridium botulinum]NFO68702.1 hypothetical protein [Clostridium botulinum]